MFDHKSCFRKGMCLNVKTKNQNTHTRTDERWSQTFFFLLIGGGTGGTNRRDAAWVNSCPPPHTHPRERRSPSKQSVPPVNSRSPNHFTFSLTCLGVDRLQRTPGEPSTSGCHGGQEDHTTPASVG